MKRIALLFLCTTLIAQQPSPKPQTFTSRSELVLVPVIVHDKSGKHIGGLTQNNFALRDNGQVRTLKVFEDVHTQTNSGTRLNHSLKDFRNYVLDPQNQRRITIILLDALNLPQSADVLKQLRAGERVLAYLSKHSDNDEPIALLILSLSGVQVVHNFTTDKQVLIQTIRDVARTTSPYVSTSQTTMPSNSPTSLAGREAEVLNSFVSQTSPDSRVLAYAQHQQRIAVSETAQAFETIAHSFAGIPGKKALIWVSCGFPSPMELDLTSVIGHAFNTLNSANIGVYPIDIYGLSLPSIAKFNGEGLLVHGVSDPRDQPRGVPVQMPELNERKFYEDTFHIFAEATGGRPCINNNDIADCLERAAHDSESYYLLGFYLRPEDRNTGLHKLTVKLNVPHGDLRYRANYDTSDVAAQTDPKKAIQSAYNSPLDYTDLSLDLVLGDPQLNGAKSKLPLVISLPPTSLYIDRDQNNLTELEISAAAFDEKNKTIADASQTVRANLKPETADKLMKEGLTHQLSLDLPPGRYRLKCVVYDHLTGKTGSVTAPVEIK